MTMFTKAGLVFGMVLSINGFLLAIWLYLLIERGVR